MKTHFKEKETTNPKEISKNIKKFYETLYKLNSSKTNVKKQKFRNTLNTKALTNQRSDLCKNEIREPGLFDPMKCYDQQQNP